ncbi:NADPH-dependent FMN reductase [Mucilaginibacter boryungensis]|uniref:NAD(P)H-dependent oxidoreductase n=1 Tax=Mucilaginibacter boryungensis TaxID=768480 RepID=A0ABR9XNC6_9SPHI|nr:NAD(P)H-dependent oxidoreductase [Mucilaginibacter boryungensis]MBE9668741.1 NAD(P)H-dependent oxidoreductase [Mucilaginibacter boryungensis]
MRIEIISGSPRHNSVTKRLALYLQQFFTDKTEHSIGLIDMREHELPMIQSVFSNPEQAPEQHRELAARMFAADAFILVTPEYNGSYSPALKNLIDHFPKQVHKTFGLVTASVGALGGMRAAQQLLLLMGGIFGIASPYMLVTPFVDKKFDADGNLLDESFQASVDTFVHEFLWLAERVSK